MKIIVNGKPSEIGSDRVTIADILRSNHVLKPEMVAVQLNEKFVGQDEFEITSVAENDAIEFIYFMGGGNCL